MSHAILPLYACVGVSGGEAADAAMPDDWVVVMTSINGPSARDAASRIAARNTDSGDSQPISAAQFLTVAEVAALMRVSKMTVYRLVHNGELPAVRVGRSFRVHAKAVHDLLETSYFDAG